MTDKLDHALDEQQIQKVVQSGRHSKYRLYAQLCTGTDSLWQMMKYDLITGLFGSMPGALGLFLRGFFYRFLLRRMGKGVTIGRNITLRGGRQIELGDRVTLDDYAVLDARGKDAEIELEERVLVARHSIIRTRGKKLRVGARSVVGCNCILATDSILDIGQNVLIAAFTYITAGGNHRFDRIDIPMIDQGFESKGGTRIGNDIWIGAHVVITDGVQVGDGAIIGANSLVNKSVRGMTVCVGSPVSVIRERKPKTEPT